MFWNMLLLRLRGAFGFLKRAISEDLRSSPPPSSPASPAPAFSGAGRADSRLQRCESCFGDARFRPSPGDASPSTPGAPAPSGAGSAAPALPSCSSSSFSSEPDSVMVKARGRGGGFGSACVSVPWCMSGKPWSDAWKAMLLLRDRRLVAESSAAAASSAPADAAASAVGRPMPRRPRARAGLRAARAPRGRRALAVDAEGVRGTQRASQASVVVIARRRPPPAAVPARAGVD